MIEWFLALKHLLTLCMIRHCKASTLEFQKVSLFLQIDEHQFPLCYVWFQKRKRNIKEIIFLCLVLV